jgi:hypothetical protein
MVTLVFPAPGGRKMKAELPFREGMTLRDCLKDPELRKYSLIGIATRSRRLDDKRRRLKMRSPILDGTTITLMHQAQS